MKKKTYFSIVCPVLQTTVANLVRWLCRLLSGPLNYSGDIHVQHIRFFLIRHVFQTLLRESNRSERRDDEESS